MACVYNIPQLEQYIYFFNSYVLSGIKKVFDGWSGANNSNAYVENDDISVRRLKVSNLSFTEEETLGGRYRFQKTISFSVSGFYSPAAVLWANKYAVLRTSDGKTLFANLDFPFQISYVYDGYQTNYTLTILSNYPVMEALDSGHMFVRNIARPCAYAIDSLQPTKIRVIGDRSFDFDNVKEFSISSQYEEANADVSTVISWSAPYDHSRQYNVNIEPILYRTVEIRLGGYKIIVNNAVGTYSMDNGTVTYDFNTISNEEVSVL